MTFTFSITKLSNQQWVKVAKALLYSFFSGFFGGLMLAGTNLITVGGSFDHKAITALIIAGVVAGINTLVVAIKQVFTPEVATAVTTLITKLEQKIDPASGEPVSSVSTESTQTTVAPEPQQPAVDERGFAIKPTDQPSE